MAKNDFHPSIYLLVGVVVVAIFAVVVAGSLQGAVVVTRSQASLQQSCVDSDFDGCGARGDCPKIPGLVTTKNPSGTFTYPDTCIRIEAGSAAFLRENVCVNSANHRSFERSCLFGCATTPDGLGYCLSKPEVVS